MSQIEKVRADIVQCPTQILVKVLIEKICIYLWQLEEQDFTPPLQTTLQRAARMFQRRKS